MPSTDLQVDDLVLFYRGDNGEVTNCHLKHELLTHKDLSQPSKEEWESAVLSAKRLSGGGSYYVANLALLLPPNDPNASGSEEPDVKPPPRNIGTLPTKVQQPSADDVVILPFSSDGNTAVIIPRSYYSKLTPLSRDIIPDMVFMATEEGVTIANLPKFDLPGISCCLLNLTSLRSGNAPNALKTDASQAKTSPPTGEVQLTAEAKPPGKTRQAFANGDMSWRTACDRLRPNAQGDK
jgi:hypothetical protein